MPRINDRMKACCNGPALEPVAPVGMVFASASRPSVIGVRDRYQIAC